MRIAHLAPLWLTVPPRDYGGLETILAYLIDAQVKQGHEVTLFACAGSKTTGRVIEVIEKPMYELLGKFDWSAVYAYEFLAYYELFKRIEEFDIVHNHLGFHFLATEPIIPIPVVTTNHSSVEPDFPYLSQKFKDLNYVSISNAQRSNAPYLNYVGNVYNAVEPEKFNPNFETNQEYFFHIGTMSKNKGVDIAVKAAHELGERLILAGEVRPEDQEFWDTEVLPLVDGQKIRFIGKVNHEQKVDLFRNSKALLFPSQWNEAFGMVAIESLASGAPVIGWNSGAIPEIVKDGENGFVVDNIEDFKKAMQNISQIDRRKCVEGVHERFTADAMAKKYVEIYQSLISQK
ncbi:MAG: glycosyltransferase family 4 protein [Candidatus Doudnabacteria bacterium]|nr:glycosyltransferase family 4 protein [Candidatus Doudnabacteria bacterium]